MNREINTESELGGKYLRLIDGLRDMKSVVVAFSAGVDSTFLLSCAVEALGADSVIAVTSDAASYQRHLFDAAKEYTNKLGVRHIVVKTDEMSDERFTENTSQRCYYCKYELFNKIAQVADKYSVENIIEGSNLDDADDFRPGFEAVKEQGVKSPLKDSGFTKADIRELSKEIGLPTWNMPQSACLASRIPFGVTIDKEKLKKIGDAETILRNMGFNLFRVRYHDSIARIELEGADYALIADESIRKEIADAFRRLGFKYAVLDLLPYRLSGPENLKDLS